MSEYRSAFHAAAAVAAILGAALVWMVARPELRRHPAAQPNPIIAEGPETTENQNAVAPGAQQSKPGMAEIPSPAAPPALAGIQLTAEQRQAIDLTFANVEVKPVHTTLRTVGTVAVDETREATVQTRFSGFIEKVFADRDFQTVHRGQPLFTIYSPDIVTTEQEYLLAQHDLQQLSEGSLPEVRSSAETLLTAAVERLQQWGVPSREIQRLQRTGVAQTTITVDSPASGVITERNALPNQTVTPDMHLYSVADLSTVWVIAQVYQTDLGSIHIGDRAAVTVDSYPGQKFTGRVQFVYPKVDAVTRTAQVRIVFRNPALALKPGMYVNVELAQSLGRRLVIPAGGVLQTGERQIVFVDRGSGYLEPRDIELGERVDGSFIVLRGLRRGERIVASANFLIDSESQLKAALGAFVPPPPGTGGEAAMNSTPAENQPEIALSTSPSPPQKGGNTLRVKITTPGGTPLEGTKVTVTFFMAAMPQMGMAALKASAQLNEVGGGFYQGTINLPSGGQWQVSIIATRNGETVASREMILSASGGM